MSVPRTLFEKIWIRHVVAEGPGGHESPAMAAAAAVTGRLTDVRRLGS